MRCYNPECDPGRTLRHFNVLLTLAPGFGIVLGFVEVAWVIPPGVLCVPMSAVLSPYKGGQRRPTGTESIRGC